MYIKLFSKVVNCNLITMNFFNTKNNIIVPTRYQLLLDFIDAMSNDAMTINTALIMGWYHKIKL